MYQDVALLRTHEIKLRLNDKEAELINAWTNYNGGQKAVLVREMLLAAIASQLNNNKQAAQK